MNCMDGCKFLITKVKIDDSREYSCQLDGRLCLGIKQCSAFEKKEKESE